MFVEGDLLISPNLAVDRFDLRFVKTRGRDRQIDRRFLRVKRAPNDPGALAAVLG